MQKKLLNGLDERDEQELREDYHKALGYRKALMKLIDKEIESLQASMRDEDHFSSPNWPYIQADRVAQTKALKKIYTYLE